MPEDATRRSLPAECYPPQLQTRFERAVTDTLARGFLTRVALSRTTLQSQPVPFGDIAATLAFQGPRIAGHAVVTGDESVFKAVRAACLGRRAAFSGHHLEDLAGELANQVVGRLKSYFIGQGLPFELGLPMRIRGTGGGLQWSSSHPSLLVTVPTISGPLYVQLRLALLDLPEADPHEEAETPLESGALSFL